MKTIQNRKSPIIGTFLSGVSEADMRRTRDRMLLSDFLSQTLRSKGLSQKAFAAKLHKTESEVSEWLSGNRNFTIDTLSDISHALGISFFKQSEVASRLQKPLLTVGLKASKQVSETPIIATLGPIGTDSCISDEIKNSLIAF